MTIRSIDLQVLIPRVTEVSKTQHILDQQNALQQQQVAEQMHQLAALRQQQIQKTPKNAGGKIEDEAQNKNGQHNSHEKHGSSPNDEDEKQDEGVDPLRGRHVDIKT